MHIDRRFLIQLCDAFLNNKMDVSDLTFFASKAMMLEEDDWEDDEIISKTIFEWDNEDICYQINKENMLLWKLRLETNSDKLKECNIWSIHYKKQKEICNTFGSSWKPINEDSIIAVSKNLNANMQTGFRRKTQKGKIYWYIWRGELSEDDDFFNQIPAKQLMKIYPDLIKYLGLEDGFKFEINADKIESVWREPTDTE